MWGKVGDAFSTIGKLFRSLNYVGFHRTVTGHVGDRVVISLHNGDSAVGTMERVSFWSGTVILRSLNPASKAQETIRISEIDHFRSMADGEVLEASFTVLHNRIALMVDATGRTQLARTEIIIPNSPGLESYRDVYLSSVAWDTRTAWARLREASIPDSWIPGELAPLEPGDRFTPGFEVAHRFSRALVRGRKYERLSGATFPEGTYLVDERDSFDHTVRHLERAFEIEITFAEGLAPAGISVTKVAQLATEDDLGPLSVSNNKVVFAVEDPGLGDRYVLEWSNSKSTRAMVTSHSEGKGRGHGVDQPGGPVR
jgi:hypothetical protein